MNSVPLAVSDYPELAAFLGNETQGAIGPAVWADRFQCFWDLNPAFHGGKFQRGWLLRDSIGAISGFFGNIPRVYSWQGEDVQVCCASSWFVRSDMRRWSMLLLREFLSQKLPMINTTPAADTLPVWSRCGFSLLKEEWADYEFVAPVSSGPLARFFADRLQNWGPLTYVGKVAGPLFTAFSMVKGALSLLPEARGLALVEVDRFGSEFDTLWASVRGASGMTAVRSAEQLNWAFRSTPMLRAGRTGFAIRIEGKLGGYVVVKSVDWRGTTCWEVVDLFFPSAPRPLLGMTLRLLIRAARDRGSLALIKIRGNSKELVAATRLGGFYRRRAPAAVLFRGGGFGEERAPHLSPFDGDRPFFP